MSNNSNNVDLRAVYLEALGEALEGLEAAVREFHAHFPKITPTVPLPRPRTFELAPGVLWPSSPNASWLNIKVSTDGRLAPITSSAEAIANAARWQPRRVLHAIRQIEAAKAWCKKRLEGLERQARHILEDQAEANRELLARAVEKQI